MAPHSGDASAPAWLGERFHVSLRDGGITLRARTDGILVAHLTAVLLAYACAAWAAVAPGPGGIVALVFASCCVLVTGLLHRVDGRAIRRERGRVRRSLSILPRSAGEGYRSEGAPATLTVDGRSIASDRVRRVVVGTYGGVDAAAFTTCLVTDTEVIRVDQFREVERAVALAHKLREALGLTGGVQVVEEGGSAGCAAVVAVVLVLVVEALADMLVIVGWLCRAQWDAERHAEVNLWLVALGTATAVVAIDFFLQGVVLGLLRPGPRRGALAPTGGPAA